MVGIPGHYRPSKTVKFLSMRGFQSVQLAAASGRPAGSTQQIPEKEAKTTTTTTSKKKTRKRSPPVAPVPQKPTSPKPASAVKRTASGRLVAAPPHARGPQPSRAAYSNKIRRRSWLVCEDLSDGAEAWPIPVFNDLGDGATLPQDFKYVVDSSPGTPAAAALMLASASAMPGGGRWCGLNGAWRGGAARSRPYYSEEGLMLSTDSAGVWECCHEKCTSKECLRNKVLSAGMDLPLEVFRTKERGWAVRCAATLVPGEIVATYEGEVITNAEAVSAAHVIFFLVQTIRLNPARKAHQSKPPIVLLLNRGMFGVLFLFFAGISTTSGFVFVRSRSLFTVLQRPQHHRSGGHGPATAAI
jgi:hypothetical protein